MPVLVSGVQYSGMWTLDQATNAVAAGTWPVAPAPHLYTWGNNSYGQLGINLDSLNKRSSPVQVGTVSWSSTSGGGYFSLGIKSNGTLWAWGRNQAGQLGLEDTANRSSPVQIGALTTWSFVGLAGGSESFAIKTDGTLWSWGRNNAGQLGLGNTTYYSSPKQIGSDTNWAFVATRWQCVAAIKTNGTLWTWGNNTNGGLGLGDSGAATSRSSPTQVGALTNWLYVTPGYQYMIAIKTDGTLWAWGSSGGGKLGLGNFIDYSSPKQVGALTTWSKIGASYLTSLAVKTDGTLWSWGANDYGQLGQNINYATSRSSPVQVGSLTTWSTPFAGWQQAGCTKTNGTLWMWGLNDNGQLGDNTIVNRSSPIQVGALTTWLNVAAGYYHSVSTLTS